MDRQAIFDRGCEGLSAQHFRQSAVADNCKYRAPNGDKCFIGHCIPDAKYHKSLEGYQVNSMNILGVLNVSTCTDEDKAFLQACQVAHDVAHSPDDMKNRLRQVAKRFNLTVPECIK